MIYQNDDCAVIQSIAVESESLTPEEYLELLEARPNMIESAKIAPPKLGDRSFGRVVVRYSKPFYRAIIQ